MDHDDTKEYEITLAKAEAKLFDAADVDDRRWVYRLVFGLQTGLERWYRALQRRAIERARRARKDIRSVGRFWH